MRRRLSELTRRLIQAGGLLKWAIIYHLARFLAMFRNRRQIVSAWPQGPVMLGPRIAIFMHFDRNGRVSQPALCYIDALIGNGYCVVFVTNSGKLAPAGAAALHARCAAVFVRRNTGYDFGAWRDVIETLNLPAQDTQELIILNDSMYGPLRPLDAMLAKIDYAEAEIWGLTESWQVRYHLQSFFVAFGAAALRSPAFAAFWAAIRPVPWKSFIIREYEVGLTQAMLKGGLRCRAIWSYEGLVNQVANQKVLEDLGRGEQLPLAAKDPIFLTRKMQINRIRDAAARQIALNPTAELWRQLLLNGFPFIKRELLRKNPGGVADLGDWVEVVRGELGLDPEPILGELRSGLKNRAP